MNVKAQISVRYQLRTNSIAVLHKFIGPGYMTSVLAPEIGSQARQIISQYTAQQVYTSREAIQKSIRDSTQKSLESNLDKLVQPEAMEQPNPRHYRDFLTELDPNSRYAGPQESNCRPISSRPSTGKPSNII